MCRALKREDLIDDERFNNAYGRVVNAQERKSITAEEIKQWESEEILARFDAESVPCAPLLTRLELMEHAQIIENESIQRLQFEGFGEVRQAAPAAKFEKTPSEIRQPAPGLGDHGPTILEELGYSEEVISNLIDNGTLVVSK